MENQEKDNKLKDWIQREELAETMLHLVGKLYRDKGVIIMIYGRPVINCSPIDLIKAHRYVRLIEKDEIWVRESLPLLKVVAEQPLPSVRIDIGIMTTAYRAVKDQQTPVTFVKEQLKDVIGKKDVKPNGPQDVVLYGFGRIGRLMARLLIENTGGGSKLRLRAIVVRKKENDNIERRASLLRLDSVHGQFNGSITVDEESQSMLVNGNYINLIYADSPHSIDYEQYGIKNAIIIDNTGVWRDEEGLGRHLESKGVGKVLLTAPGKGNIKNIVHGINSGEILPEDRILSAASCTTNAIVPVLKAVNDKFGIENGHLETIHAYTNDQNLLDNFHKGDRRGRSGPLNMVLTNTGAAKAVVKAIPELKGKLTAHAIRVPTPNVSMAILSLNFKTATTKDELNEYLRQKALHSEMQEQIDYTSSLEIVSTDVVGSRFACVVDSQVTIVEEKRCVLYVWYDNEFGYSCQVLRVVEQMAGIKIDTYPKLSVLSTP
ncbi:glyceraldehyde-3-phosphate dehydrogenase [bacterium]|nr:glyceraldehyde-3-phosphate dehydrogenase [bacterium]